MANIPKEPEQVMRMRGGSVLGKKTILKSDHFPGCQNKRLTPQIDGAPNYRQVVYINGRPFVLRDVERPFSNLEYTLPTSGYFLFPFVGVIVKGINRDRVEQMEDRLKEDILVEAARYGNKILVTDELPDGQMVDQWEPVSCYAVKKPLEVYEELQVEGYLVDYERVPVTDEKSPKEQDFDILVSMHV